MSLLQQLHLFVSLFQASGFIPFTTEYESKTNKFTKFNFSFKHFMTWWFVFWFTIQILVPLCFTYIMSNLLVELATDVKLPITVTILSSVSSVNFYLHFGICRWIVLFRYPRLRNAVQAVQKVESLLGASSFKVKRSLLKCFLVGFTFVIATVWV